MLENYFVLRRISKCVSITFALGQKLDDLKIVAGVEKHIKPHFGGATAKNWGDIPIEYRDDTKALAIALADINNEKVEKLSFEIRRKLPWYVKGYFVPNCFFTNLEAIALISTSLVFSFAISN